MITLAEVEKLSRVHTVEPIVLSVYLNVPRSPAERRRGALGLAADCCPDWGTAALPVPDLIEEMVSRTLEDGGRVLVVHDAPGGIVARMASSPRLGT